MSGDEGVRLALDVLAAVGERDAHRDRRDQPSVLLQLAGDRDGNQDEREQDRGLE